jgi:hypothetical protein
MTNETPNENNSLDNKRYMPLESDQKFLRAGAELSSDQRAEKQVIP